MRSWSFEFDEIIDIDPKGRCEVMSAAYKNSGGQKLLETQIASMKGYYYAMVDGAIHGVVPNKELTAEIEESKMNDKIDFIPVDRPKNIDEAFDIVWKTCYVPHWTEGMNATDVQERVVASGVTFKIAFDSDSIETGSIKEIREFVLRSMGKTATKVVVTPPAEIKSVVYKTSPEEEAEYCRNFRGPRDKEDLTSFQRYSKKLDELTKNAN
jgi:hypothetical protein